jgi:hypothetical protein
MLDKIDTAIVINDIGLAALEDIARELQQWDITEKE